MARSSPVMAAVGTLRADREGGVVVLTLNDPARRNALTAAMRAALIDALRAAAKDPATVAVVVTGANGAFCAGQDRGELRSLHERDVEAWVRGLAAMYDALRAFPKPTVAALNGAAAGAGLQIALCCDRRVAHAGARLLQPEMRAGLASVMGSFLIGLFAGQHVNQRLSLGCEALDAAAAQGVGLVDEVVAADPGLLLPRALEVARGLAAGADAVAYRLTKLWLREMTEPGFRAAIEAGVRAQREAVAAGAVARSLGTGR